MVDSVLCFSQQSSREFIIELSPLSLLPSLLAIFLALYSKNVLFSLFGGILLALLILHNFMLVESFVALYDLLVGLLSESWIAKTLAFAILVGSVMELIERSGGINGFVSFMQERHNLVSSQRSALFVSYGVGVFLFIESSISSLVAGAVGKPLCDSYGVPRAKLAFVSDSTSAPISSLLVLNGWGALLLGLINTEIESGLLSGESVSILINAVLYNFYAMSALLVTFLALYFNIEIGAMKNATPALKKTVSKADRSVSMFYMVLPIVLMIFSVFFFLYLTGEGDILHGSGSSAIFYTMIVTLLFMFVYYIGTKNMSPKSYTQSAYQGAKKLLPIALILLFAFAIGKLTGELKTGLYLASLAEGIVHPTLLAALIFLLSALISFATGTSWGTFSIMIPVAVPMAVGLDADVVLAIGAVISGGVFGDHCSPISDTTIISSMASECEVVEHVQTQLPYALISGGFALSLFILFSYWR